MIGSPACQQTEKIPCFFAEMQQGASGACYLQQDDFNMWRNCVQRVSAQMPDEKYMMIWVKEDAGSCSPGLFLCGYDPCFLHHQCSSHCLP